MRRTLIVVVIGIVGGLSLKVTTAEKAPDAYVAAMKRMAAAMPGLNAAVKETDFPAVITQATVLIEAMPVVQSYWTGKDTDGLKLANAAAKAAADLRVAAALMSGDGIEYSAKEVTELCGQCHAAHRERLADGTFQIK